MIKNSSILNMGVTKLVFELKPLRSKIKGVLTGCIVAMVTCYVMKMSITCLQMVIHLFDAICCI